MNGMQKPEVILGPLRMARYWFPANPDTGKDPFVYKTRVLFAQIQTFDQITITGGVGGLKIIQ